MFNQFSASSSNEGTISYCNVTSKLNKYLFYNDALRNQCHNSRDMKKSPTIYFIKLLRDF